MTFGMGWQEIAIIAVVAIIIFGPDKLPELAGQAGKLLRDFRRITQDMSGEFEKQTGVSVRDLKQNVDKELAGLKSEMAGTTATVTKEINSVKSSVNKTASSVSKSVNSAASKKAGSASKASTTAKASSGAKSSSSGSSTKTASAAVKSTKAEAPPAKASKHDPLADVSFLDNAGDASTNGAGKPAAATGSAATLVGAGAMKGSAEESADRADAVARARSRRQSAGYNQHSSNFN